VEFLLTKLKSKPKIFLSGGSYGGAICFKACLKQPHKYSGVIFLAPAIRNLAEAGPIMKKIGKCIGFLCPRVRLFGDKYDSGTKNNQSQRILADPYVYNDGLVPGSVRTILNAMD
jgi:alpha-beta hydrolase superfamily lysophospholipase